MIFKIGDRVVLERHLQSDNLSRVANVSGVKRINVTIVGHNKTFDEHGVARGQSEIGLRRECIRLATPADIVRIQLERMTRDLGNVRWSDVSEDKRRRIWAILREVDG